MESSAKIVCTIGPSVEEEEKIRSLIDSGVKMFRLNLSHRDVDYHKALFKKIRNIDSEIAIMLDLPGPKIRLGDISKKKEIKPGEIVILTIRDVQEHEIDENIIPVQYKKLPLEVHENGTLFINDGLLELRIREKTDEDVVCEAITSGVLSSRKGINAPGSNISITSPTERDLYLISEMLELNPDYFCVSYVRSADDLLRIKKYMAERDTHIPLIAKIEHRDGVRRFRTILYEADGIMVARGDLAIELPAQEVPFIQKELISMAQINGTPTIVATQMLDSMINSPVPTRAETSDVTNAILDGADAVMLSGETAAGKYPLEAVKAMKRIVDTTFKLGDKIIEMKGTDFEDDSYFNDIHESIGQAASNLSRRLNAYAILSVTASGTVAKMVSKYRPPVPILTACHDKKTRRRLQLYYGIEPFEISEGNSFQERINNALESAVGLEYVKKDSLIIMVMGSYKGVVGTSNTILVHKIDELLD